MRRASVPPPSVPLTVTPALHLPSNPAQPPDLHSLPHASAAACGSFPKPCHGADTPPPNLNRSKLPAVLCPHCPHSHPDHPGLAHPSALLAFFSFLQASRPVCAVPSPWNSLLPFLQNALSLLTSPMTQLSYGQALASSPCARSSASVVSATLCFGKTPSSSSIFLLDLNKVLEDRHTVPSSHSLTNRSA
jgi:hypothetical protein